MSTIPQNDVVKIAHSQLILRDDNRSVARDTENTKRRAANIKALGILQNIVVTPSLDKEGFYVLEAGYGRYESVELLIKSNDAQADTFFYPAMVANDANLSAIIKLAENGNRDNLHPVDEFLAYQQAVTAGNNIKQIAEANGVTQKYVKQRLALANLAPELLDSLRKNEMAIEVAQVFTSEPSLERQVMIFNTLDDYELDEAFYVRRLLNEKLLSKTDPKAIFVGREAYKKAGGVINSSLFDDSETWINPEIVHALAKEKLSAVKAELEADGWSWVEVEPEEKNIIHHCATVQALALSDDIKAELQILCTEKDQLDALDEPSDEEYERLEELDFKIDELKEMGEFTAEDKAISGCYVYLDGTGKLGIKKGALKPEAAKAYFASNGLDGENEGGENLAGDDDCQGYSAALTSDLAATRTAIIQGQLATHPELAFDLGVFSLADNQLRQNKAGYASRSCGLSVEFNNLEGADPEAMEGIEKARKALNLTWTAIGNSKERFEAFCSLEKSEKEAIFAFCVSRSVFSRLADSRTPAPVMEVTCQRLQPDYRKTWTPTRDKFFKRLGTDTLMNIGQELFGASWVDSAAGKQKRQIVDEVSGAFSGKVALDEAAKAKVSSWVPAGF